MMNYFLKSTGVTLIIVGIVLGFFEFLIENHLVILALGIIFLIVSKFIKK